MALWIIWALALVISVWLVIYASPELTTHKLEYYMFGCIAVMVLVAINLATVAIEVVTSGQWPAVSPEAFLRTVLRVLPLLLLLIPMLFSRTPEGIDL